MRRLILSTIIMILVNYGFAQELSVKAIFKPDNLMIEIGIEKEVIIPIVIEIERRNNDSIKGTIILGFDIGDRFLVKKVKIRPDSLNFTFKKRSGIGEIIHGKEIMLKTFYVIVSKDTMNIIGRKIIIRGTVQINDQLMPLDNQIELSFSEAHDLVYTLGDYMQNKELKLNYVSAVESDKNILTIFGHHEKDRNGYQTRRISLYRNDVFVINDILTYNPAISLVAVPFKIRPPEGDFNRVAASGLSNIGVNVDFFGLKQDRFYSTGKKSQLRFGLGLWAGPSVEELDSIHTKGYLKKDVKSKQLFISTGLTFTFSYNNLNFSFVPLGIDFGTSTIGKEWIYDKKRWRGFGIGIEPKIFSPILNK